MTPKPKTEAVKKTAAEQERYRSQRVQNIDIAPLPNVENVKRRVACRKSFVKFCKTYFKNTCVSWSRMKQEMARLYEKSIKENSRAVIALPRGNGKTSLALILIIWATAYGYRQYVIIVSATTEEAKKNLNTIRTQIQTQSFAEDFPEISYPLLQLDTFQRAATTQLLDGVKTKIISQPQRLKFADTCITNATGAIIECTSVKGTVRGKNSALRSGKILRPDMIIIDDPQNDTQARNSIRVAEICETIQKGFEYAMVGADNTTSLILGTVIQQGDVMETFLNDKTRETIRMGAIETMPANLDTWQDWYNIYTNNRDDANIFYKENEKELLEEYVVNVDTFDKKRFINVECALMFEFLYNPEAFYSERQNDPAKNTAVSGTGITSEYIENAIVDADYFAERKERQRFAGIDVHEHLLYWLVIDIEPSTRETLIIDYGIFPEAKLQARDQMMPSYRRKYYSDPLINALADCIEFLQKKFQIKKIAIDTGYRPKEVYRVISNSQNVAAIRGYSQSARQAPISEWLTKPGEARGSFWIERRYQHNPTPTMLLDVSIIKDELMHGFEKELIKITPTMNQRILAAHLSAEFPTFIEATYTRNVWNIRPNRSNHLLDCLVYATSIAMRENALAPEGMQELENVDFRIE